MRKADIKDEIVRCGRDPIHFINEYVKIRHPVRGLIPFKTFMYQDRTLEAFLTKRHNVILKPRQMGFTELTAAFVCWLILFHRDISVLCMATKSDTAKNLVKRVRTALKHVPKWLMLADINADNKLSLELTNGSFVKSSSKSADAGRSEALSLLVVDEAAHIKGFDEIWTGIKPTVTAGGRIIMLSTPLGMGNVFHTTYEEAEKGQNGFNPIVVHWWEHPDYGKDAHIDPEKKKMTSSWFENETKGLSVKQIAQEYENAFLASGDTFFEATEIAFVMGEVAQPHTSELAGELRLFSPPDPTKKYLITMDGATGDGADTSAFHVFEVETMEQVCEFQGKLKAKEFAAVGCDVGMRYNQALMVVENNAVGLAILEHIHMRAYPNLWYSKKGAKLGKDRLGDVGPAGYNAMTSDYMPGLNTTGMNRSVMLNKLEELIRLRKVHFHSERFRKEMETFIWNNGRPEARHGRTDDLIMAAAIGVWVRENHFGDFYSTPDMTRAMLAAMKVVRTNNVQIQGASKNPDHVPGRMMGSFATQRNPYVLELGDGKRIDYAAEFGMYIPRKG